MPFISHVSEVAYERRLYELFWRYCEESIEEEETDRLSLYCFEPPYDKLRIVRDAAERWRKLNFECWQTHERERTQVCWIAQSQNARYTAP